MKKNYQERVGSQSYDTSHHNLHTKYDHSSLHGCEEISDENFIILSMK